MFDFHDGINDFLEDGLDANKMPNTGSIVRKRLFDLVGALLLIVPLMAFMLVLCGLNPLFNRGPLLFIQDRMGIGCDPFSAFKFRTMSVATGRTRGAYDTLETERITPLGRLLRKTRIDELPQIINVLRGEMSLIGPRPDSYTHACVYLREVSGYRERHRVVPGISGYAQTEVGYVDGPDGIERKVAADLYYIAHATLAFDLWITWRTVSVIAFQRGS